MRNILLTALFLMSPKVWADHAQFQLGYVFDSWTSNFIYSGSESRIPASFSLTSGDFGLSADTAFVAGDYEQAATDTTLASSYKSSQFSDSSLSATWICGWVLPSSRTWRGP